MVSPKRSTEAIKRRPWTNYEKVISSVSFSHIVNWDSFLILCHRCYDCFHIVRHYGICFSTFNSLLVFLIYWVDLNVWFCWDFLPFLSRFFSVFFSFTLLTFWMLCDYLEDYREILQISWFRKKEKPMFFFRDSLVLEIYLNLKKYSSIKFRA